MVISLIYQPLITIQYFGKLLFRVVSTEAATVVQEETVVIKEMNDLSPLILIHTCCPHSQP